MSSQLQIDANRKNSESSTGPTTPEGKAASSQNSFRHGLCGSTFLMLANESVEDFIEFANGIRAEHKPITMTEDAIVSKIIQSLWMSTRAVNLQAMLFAETPHPDKERLSLYIRYQSVHDRAFSKALLDLKSLRQEARKEAREQEIGSVPQPRKEELVVAKIRNLNARSEAYETATQARKARLTLVAPANVATTRPSAALLTATHPTTNDEKSAA